MAAVDKGANNLYCINIEYSNSCQVKADTWAINNCNTRSWVVPESR